MLFIHVVPSGRLFPRALNHFVLYVCFTPSVNIGWPPPQVTWYRDGKPLNTSDVRFDVDVDVKNQAYVLCIHDATPEDAGVYRTSANNNSGATSVSTHVAMDTSRKVARRDKSDVTADVTRTLIEDTTSMTSQQVSVMSEEGVVTTKDKVEFTATLTQEAITKNTGEEAIRLSDTKQIIQEPQELLREPNEIQRKPGTVQIEPEEVLKEPKKASKKPKEAQKEPKEAAKELPHTKKVEITDGFTSSESELSSSEEEPAPAARPYPTPHRVSFDLGGEIGLSVQVSGQPAWPKLLPCYCLLYSHSVLYFS